MRREETMAPRPRLFRGSPVAQDQLLPNTMSKDSVKNPRFLRASASWTPSSLLVFVAQCVSWGGCTGDRFLLVFFNIFLPLSHRGTALFAAAVTV